MAKLYDTLPNLPGYRARLPLEPGDHKHYKKTTLTYLKGYAIDEPPVYADLLPSALEELHHVGEACKSSGNTRTPVGSGGAQERWPKWIENDKKVLRWTGYFKEAVPESPHENHRVRQITICYYLADDTLEVLEPRVANSGIWQGVFLKRHKIPKADGKPYTESDIRVGENVSMYARVFRIVDADDFTRKYLSEKGINLGPKESIPIDPYGARAALKDSSIRPEGKEAAAAQKDSRSGVLQQGKFQAYLLNSKKVLRFYCVWDDRQRLYGDCRHLRLHFHLEDSTVEILEDVEQNCGREHFPVFLHRGQLPKDPEAAKGSHNLDKKSCFGIEDFRIGSTILVYGRPLYIFDCDDFTRTWYQENMGIQGALMAAVDIKEPRLETNARSLPPYNGYGSLADSAENCKHLIPKPPKRDFYKLINKSKTVLRFGARFLHNASHPVSEDHRERDFIVSYFMADDSISIFEHPTDGFPGGKFLERGQVPTNNKHTGEIITDLDLYVGAELVVYKHAFMLESADEYTLQYMENNCQTYKPANWERAVELARPSLGDGGDKLRAALVEVNKTSDAPISIECMVEVFRLMGAPLKKHEVISIWRRLSKQSPGGKPTAEALLQMFGA